ncbi:extracellular solute-binding protein [Ensifer adhaerens]
MTKYLKFAVKTSAAIGLAAAIGLSTFGSALADPVELSITCRCVSGGVSSSMANWLKNSVFPAFETQEKTAGRDVVVTLVEFGGSDEALKQQHALDLKVGGGSDILFFDGFWIPDFVEAGLLKPLKAIAGDRVDSWDAWTQVPEGLQALMSYKGQRYGLATTTDTRVIYYRKDVFAKAGIPIPWQPTSWQDILDTARKLKAADAQTTPLQIDAGTAMGEATTMQGWTMLALGANAPFVNADGNKWLADNPGVVGVLDFYKKVYVDEKLGDARLQLSPGGREKSFGKFRDGKIAMLVEGNWFYSSVIVPGAEFGIANRDEVVGWAKMPAEAPGKGIKGQDFVSVSGGNGYLINPNTKSADAAWKLFAFMNSKPMIDAYEKLEPSISVRRDIAIPDPVIAAQMKALLDVTTVRPLSPAYSKVSSAAQLATEQVVSGGASPAEAGRRFSESVVKIVGPERITSTP